MLNWIKEKLGLIEENPRVRSFEGGRKVRFFARGKTISFLKKKKKW